MIDPDEIGPNEDLVSPERLAKGDLEVVRNARGKVCRAMPAAEHLTIIKELVRRGVMPHHYEIYGVGFLELRTAFRAPWAVRSAAVLLEQWGKGVSVSSAGTIYLNVCKGLNYKRVGVVEHVLEERKEFERRDFHDVYKECFERLIELMDEEREKVNKEIYG